MSNEELVTTLEKIKNGDETAFEQLARQYAPLIRRVCRSFANAASGEGIKGFYSDLYQDLTYSLFRAAETFDIMQDKVTFGNYAKRCLENCAVSSLRKARTRRKRELKVKESLKKESLEEENSSSGELPFFYPVSRESLLETADLLLSPFEKTVLEMYLDGGKAAEISSETGRSVKSVKNALFRGKSKLRGFYSDII